MSAPPGLRACRPLIPLLTQRSLLWWNSSPCSKLWPSAHVKSECWFHVLQCSWAFWWANISLGLFWCLMDVGQGGNSSVSLLSKCALLFVYSLPLILRRHFGNIGDICPQKCSLGKLLPFSWLFWCGSLVFPLLSIFNQVSPLWLC